MTDKILEQAHFCITLMERILKDIEKAEKRYGALDKHTVIQADIIRLRRELNTLREMLEPQYQGKE